MIKVGHHLSDAEIEQRYSTLGATIGMPAYFYEAVAAFPSVQSPARILDLGCGAGELLQALHSRFARAALLGTEISSGRLQIARQRLGTHIALVQTGGTGRLPFEDGAFDLVFITEVLEHLKAPESLLSEVHRVLSPTGRMILTTPNADAFFLWPLVERLAMRLPRLPLVERFLPYEHPLRTLQPIDTVFAFDDVRELLRQSSFSVERFVGREMLPSLFSLPGLRWLDYQGWLPRHAVDHLFNNAGASRLAYRLFWECTKIDDAP